MKNTELKLSEREWTCSNCGTKHDRDLLASRNIAMFAGQEMSSMPPEMSALVESVNEECIKSF